VGSKIIWIVIVLITGSHYFTMAQKFDIGLLAGPQVYKVSFQDTDDRNLYSSTFKVGYRIGAYISFPMEDDFSWSTELYYSRKGRKIETIENGFINDAAYNFGEISVLLRKQFDLNIIEKIKSKWFVTLGPNINYWISGRGSIDATVDLDYKVKFGSGAGDLENNYIVDGNRWLFGLDFGLGIDTPLINSQKFEVEVRFTLGQTYLGAKDGSVPVNDFQVDDNLRSNYRTMALVLKYGLDLDLKNAKKGKSTLRIKKKRR
jgi:hypothetical protein